MASIWTLLAVAAFSLTTYSVDAANCDCEEFKNCLDGEKAKFFRGYRDCLNEHGSSLTPHERSCFQSHADELEASVNFFEDCVFGEQSSNGLCGSRKRRSNNILNVLRSKRATAINKRQTGTFKAGRFPARLREFEREMIKCEKQLSKRSDEEKQPFITDDIRGGVIDAILTCKEKQGCEIDAFEASNAFASCSKSSDVSASNVDKKTLQVHEK